MTAQNWTVCPIRSSGWAEKRTYKKPYEMEQTFEQMKDAAKALGRPEAAEDIARKVLALLKK